MTKTVVIGKKIEGVTQLSRFMVLSGDKIVLLDAKTGLSPKKVTSKVIDKNLYIYEEGATDPSVILNDYKTFENSVQIQGIDQGGTYYDYAMGDSGTMALSSTPVVAPVAAHEPWLSTNAMLGIGILAAGGVALAAGGGGGGGDSTSSPAVVVNPLTPTATITMSDVLLNQTETATVTIVFSEAVSGFTNADVVVQNGTLTAFSTADNITWTATFTPTDGLPLDNSNVITLTAGSYTSTANGTVGAGATSANYTVDTAAVAPTPLTVSITDDQVLVANIAGTSVLYTFTFSEAVTGFSAADVTVVNGTKGTFTQLTTSTFTLAVTPTAGFTGDMTVDVPAGAATSNAGNPNIAAFQSIQAVDMAAPTAPSVSIGDAALTAGETSAVTIVFTEAVKNFSNATLDLTGANGTLSPLSSADNITWTALFTPTANITDTTNVIRVLNTYTDMAGNAGTLGVSANFTVDTNTTLSDTVKPTLMITDDEPMVTANMDGSNSDGSTDANGGNILYMFTFSEAVTGFDFTDITLLNATATAGNFIKVSDNVYTLSVLPDAGYEGDITVSAAASNATDIVGNAIDATNPSTLSSLQAVDMRAPFPLDPTHSTAVTPILADPTHQRIILTFDENLEQVNQTAPENFGVVINGDSWTVKSIGVSDNSAGMADNQVFLYFDSITNARGELFDWTNAGISVSYTDGTTDITSVIQDLAGNDVTSFNDFNSDTLAPNALITIDDTILSSGNIAKMTVSFSEAASSLDIGDFTVQNGFLENLATANGGKTWTADLKANANIDDTSNIITLGTSYTDAHGINGIAATSGNYAIDTKVPLFLNAVANNANDTIVLTFDDVLDAANHASGSDFYVTDGSTTTDPITGITTINQIDVLGVGISGTTMTLSMKPMDAGNWKVIYTDINGDTQYAIQDIYGSDTTGFSWTNAVI